MSSGIDRATPSSSSSSPSRNDDRGSSNDRSNDDSSSSYDDGGSSVASSYSPPPMWDNGTTSSYPAFRMPRIDIGLDGFAGAQMVFESEGSYSLELGLIIGGFRMTTGVSHYFESQMDGGRVTMTMPSFTLGLRLAQHDATKLWAEAGVTHVSTNDPAGSSSITGATLVGRLEHPLSSRVLLVGSGGVTLFDGFQAYSGRVAVRMNHIEAGFRILDFTVGPALFGPELGVAF